VSRRLDTGWGVSRDLFGCSDERRPTDLVGKNCPFVSHLQFNLEPQSPQRRPADRQIDPSQHESAHLRPRSSTEVEFRPEKIGANGLNAIYQFSNPDAAEHFVQELNVMRSMPPPEVCEQQR
jgi:hypothetical protein